MARCTALAHKSASTNPTRAMILVSECRGQVVLYRGRTPVLWTMYHLPSWPQS